MISATIGFLDSMFPRRSNNTGIRPSRTTQTATSASDAARKSQPITPSPKARELSNVSTLAVPDSVFHAENFMLGAGIVIIQPTTGKIVLVNEGKDWFLPKGRKDQGESLEQTALREGFEESGYRADFLPLYVQTNAPPAPDAPRDKYKVIGEPLFTCINFYGGRKLRRPGEYLTFYYVGQIGPDAVREENTGMWNEKEYVGHLLTIDEARRNLQLSGDNAGIHIVNCAWHAWSQTVELDEKIAREERLKSEPDPQRRGRSFGASRA